MIAQGNKGNLTQGGNKPAQIAQQQAKMEMMTQTATRSTNLEGITPREHEILKLICEELSPGEISEELKISEKTFFNHRANILHKTGAKTNVGLVKYAIIKKVVEVEV